MQLIVLVCFFFIILDCSWASNYVITTDLLRNAWRFDFYRLRANDFDYLKLDIRRVFKWDILILTHTIWLMPVSQYVIVHISKICYILIVFFEINKNTFELFLFKDLRSVVLKAWASSLVRRWWNFTEEELN